MINACRCSAFGTGEQGFAVQTAQAERVQLSVYWKQVNLHIKKQFMHIKHINMKRNKNPKPGKIQ